MYRLNAALKLFDGLIIIPILQVCWTTSAIIQGGIYFKDFEGFTTKQAIGFSGGILVVFIGVYILTSSPKIDDNDNNTLDISIMTSNSNRSRKDAGNKSINLDYIEMSIINNNNIDKEQKEKLLS